MSFKEKLEAAEQHLKTVAVQSAKDYPNKDKLMAAIHDAGNAIRSALAELELATGKGTAPRIPYGRYAGALGDNVETHESFGVVSLTKVTGRRRLFGAMVDSLPSFVALRINRGSRHTDPRLHTEYYSHSCGFPAVCEVFMTAYQWAELLTSLNGVDIPCTLRAVNGVDMDPVPENVTTPMEQISNDANAAAANVVSKGRKEFEASVEDVSNAIDASGIGKRKAEDLKARVRGLLAFADEPVHSAAWASQQLAEVTERLVATSKVEIAAAITSMATAIGTKELPKQCSALSTP